MLPGLGDTIGFGRRRIALHLMCAARDRVSHVVTDVLTFPGELVDRLTDADIQGGIKFALLQMRAETLTRIDEALFVTAWDMFGTALAEPGSAAADRRRGAPA